MAVGVLREPPYYAVQALTAWAAEPTRNNYLRGRALLAGHRWDALTPGEQVDFTHAAILEPMLSGSMTHIDEMLDRWYQHVADASITEETFGMTPEAEAAQRDLETMFPPASGEPL